MMYPVLSNTPIARDTYRLVLKVGELKNFHPGQFAHVKIPHSEDLLLRRPISINRYKNGEMHLVYRLQGEGTKRLSRVKPGEVVDCLAPLGNGFEKSGKIWLVGGGIGVAPLVSMECLQNAECTAFLGFQNKDAVFCEAELKSFCKAVYIATDDGSYGEKAFVTDLVKEKMALEMPDAVFACGPKPMFLALKALGLPLYISLEQHMGCGMGGCAVCVHRVNGHNTKICVDGPVFLAEEVAL